ncbi:GumC family protein [Calothrix sp. 336/3]|uniref:GumC family protein n=1 Tax=Calothrix sp. 336/3 TaxID=1337936 RepID=UPI0004E2B16B|nr:polysaccharide biosynthesis tyrosine autokinase [Calothrix sp. 336/3]AKG23522.1 capsular biosynthesis protein [Calothrix sp. 336/3]
MQIKEQELQHLKNPNLLAKETYWFLRRPESELESKGFGQILPILRRRLGLITSIAVVVTMATSVWTITRTQKYEGKFQLLVEPLKTSDSELLVLLSETLRQNVNEITRQNSTSMDYQALLEVLKSPKLIEPVVQELSNKYPEVNYDRLVGNDITGKLPTGRDGTLYITRITKGKDESRVVEVHYRDVNPQKVQVVLDRVSQAYRNYSIEQQQSNLSQGIKFVEKQIPKLRGRVNNLQGQLQIYQQRYGIFNPELQGEQLLKRLDEMKTSQQETSKKLIEARSLFASLQQQLGMGQSTAIAASAASESPQYQKILNDIREIDAKIAKNSTRFHDANPIMLNLREEREKLLPLLNAEAKRTLGSKSTTDNSQISLGTYQNSIRRELTQQLANTGNQIKTLEASLSNIQKNQVQLNKQIREYPVISRNYTNIQRELQVANDTLNQLLSKQEALRVDAAQQDVPWELIMPPTLPRDSSGNFVAVSPNKPRNAAIGALGGILAGIMVAFLLENLRNVVHDPEEAKRAAQLPLLGLIPFDKEFKKQWDNVPTQIGYSGKIEASHRQITDYIPRKRQELPHSLSQAFCSLYTRIQPILREASIRSLAITSATPGEGKTTVALNLAKIAAEAGQKVLLVDADFRRPQIHRLLGLGNTSGLTEVLSQGLDISDAIQRSPEDDNLFILTAGQVMPNPTKLFSSQRMQNLVERSQTHFDLVIYDTTNVLGVLDTNLLTHHLDGVLLVTGMGKIPRPTFQQVLEELKTSPVMTLGMVANTLEL